MDPSDQINAWLGRTWAKSDKGALWLNIKRQGVTYNVAVMKDHNDSTFWVFAINQEFDDRKFRTEIEAKIAALTKLAEILGL